jgi:hypothetical protein
VPQDLAARNRVSGLPPTATHIRVWLYANTTDTTQPVIRPRTDQAECPVAQCRNLITQPIRMQGNQVREVFDVWGMLDCGIPIVEAYSTATSGDVIGLIEAAFGIST